MASTEKKKKEQRKKERTKCDRRHQQRAPPLKDWRSPLSFFLIDHHQCNTKGLRNDNGETLEVQ